MYKNEQHISWEEYFMNLAVLTSFRSKDLNTKVGACIINQNKKVIGLGYNGFITLKEPQQENNDDMFPREREGNWLETKYPYVIHAEANAIINSKQDLTNCILYVTLFPCNECAKLVVQCGISKVIYLSDKYIGTDSNIAAKNILDKAGVKYEQYSGNTISWDMLRKPC